MIVKVCGMRENSNIRKVESLGIDWMGFIFYGRSSRYVSDVPSYLPIDCKRVGVFVNSPVNEIVNRQLDFGLDMIQLHGDEDPTFCDRLRHCLPYCCGIIKMVKISGRESFDTLSPFTPFVDYFLFETPSLKYGGSGTHFDWSLTTSYKERVPFLLSGGICPSDWHVINQFTHPYFAGIDLNSRFEESPGIKNVELLQEFLTKLDNWHCKK